MVLSRPNTGAQPMMTLASEARTCSLSSVTILVIGSIICHGFGWRRARCVMSVLAQGNRATGQQGNKAANKQSKTEDTGQAGACLTLAIVRSGPTRDASSVTCSAAHVRTSASLS